MWILESSSELFQGRRMWLKPGKSYLFGRVKKDGVRFAIEHKTISRKHFIIKVDDVSIEDVGNIHARTKVTIEDQNSKAGTHVNGQQIKSSSGQLTKEENYIKPGSLPEDLVIRWHPFVLTFNLLKKEIKAGALKAKQDRVKDLDVKAVSEYIAGQTTHLVVNKRNTPKSLQALIDGRPLVAESYIDALEYATTPSDLNEEENLSPLEQDFDSAWPNPEDHLPPPGREPTLRPADSYKPDASRKTVFETFTFVFLDQTQYDNLLPPITTGHGKALLYKVVVNETTTEELVTYMHNAAGSKGFGDTQGRAEKGGVILVRYKGDAGNEEWTNTLVNETSLKLDQRAIDQGEFLDAILANDGSLLRQSVPFESNHDGTDAPPATAASLAPLSQGSRDASGQSNLNGTKKHSRTSDLVARSSIRPQAAVSGHGASERRSSELSSTGEIEQRNNDNESQSQPPAKRARFTVPKSRVYDFDDDFDPSNVVPYQDDEQEHSVPVPQSQRQYTPLQDEIETDAVREEPTPSKKRTRSEAREASTGFDDEMDDLLPAAALMKRRKLAKESQNGTQPEPAKKKPIAALFKKPKEEKDIDVREVARAQRKAEEEQAQKERGDEEELKLEPGQAMPVYDVETVLIDLPTRERQSFETNQAESDRWDPAWNGRKNFKGFRRARNGTEGDGVVESRGRNHSKVIVPLVDAKTSTYGMGDQYWDKTEEEKERERRKKTKASQRTTQSQSDQSRASHARVSQTVRETDGEDEHNAAANGSASPTSPALSRLQHEAAEIMDHVIDVEEPRRTRASDTQTQTQTTGHSMSGPKRAANGIGRGGAAKRQKTLPVTVVHGSDSDDSDDMKFQFGSRRRGRGKT